MTQTDLLAYRAPVRASDPNVIASDAKRLSAQCDAVLSRLHAGPATNVELAAISLKYTSRISDLRAAGYEVECVRGEGGVNVYRLVTP